MASPPSTTPRSSSFFSTTSIIASPVALKRTPPPPLLLLLLSGIFFALVSLPLRITAFVLPAGGVGARTRPASGVGHSSLSTSIVIPLTTGATTGLFVLASATGKDGGAISSKTVAAGGGEGERVLSLHTLEVPLQDDPGNYRTYLEEHFKGSSLLRWHLGSVDTAKGVAHAEVVIVSPPGLTPPVSSQGRS